MKTFFQVLLSLILVAIGTAQAQDWSTSRQETPRFKAENHRWVASTESRGKIFTPIVLPKVNIVPHIHVSPHYSSYKSKTSDSVLRFRYPNQGRYR
jgi:hypothetical protein